MRIRSWHITMIIMGGLMACKPSIPKSIQLEMANIPKTVDYNIHIKPILSDRCFTCHGNDQNKLKAGLRLDIEAEAKKELIESSGYAIVPGHPYKSQLVNRILDNDSEKMMPPPESQLSLTDREKALLIAWIDQGAEYKPHWSFCGSGARSCTSNRKWTIGLQQQSINLS